MQKISDCLSIEIRGIVQGVGFRPFIYNLASEMKLRGFVANTSDGVFIAVEGENLDIFAERIRTDTPPMARIMSMALSPREYCGFESFSIKESSESRGFTLISQDIALCPDCLSELLDQKDRRFLYPFINCTNCGPRYTITRSVPYDRTNTTMHSFPMCRDCSAEFDDPEDRRFHAQPNACPVCGPSLTLHVQNPRFLSGGDANPLESAVIALTRGAIVAVKGLGGFHLACEAENRDAVEKLRMLKRKSNKPFALMAPDPECVRKYGVLSEREEALLSSPGRPVVLIQKKTDSHLPDAVAPLNRFLGFMFPYTPLHYLLFSYPLEGREIPHFSALVMTSGNISEEPIVTDNDEALQKLSGIADVFLLHNRDIFARADDSVMRVTGSASVSPDQHPMQSVSHRFSGISFLRRSRGYVPLPIPLGSEGPDVVGCGADLKNTFTVTRGSYAIPSQHIGDMENYETLQFFEETLRHIKSVFRAFPVAVAHDLHPGYLSTQWALNEGRKAGDGKGEIPAFGIQHHYAHIASVMAEKGLQEKVIGVSFDGNGYGLDGTLWGSEFLIADLSGFRRAGHFNAVALPGGQRAILEPWRTAVSYLKEAAGDDVWVLLKNSGLLQRYGEEELKRVLQVAEKRAFSPISTAAGRLFDAVSSILGMCDRNTFEGEAAIALESRLSEGVSDEYPVDIVFDEVISADFSHTLLRIIDEMKRGTAGEVISACFHNTVASTVIRIVVKLALISNLHKVVLSGGVFQNLVLLNTVIHGLREEGLQVFVNELVPCNDAGISLGQAYVVRERIRTGIHVTQDH